MKVEIKTTTDRIESTAGILLAGKIFHSIEKSLLKEYIEPLYIPALKSMFGLLVQGRTSYEEINLFRNSSLFKESFNLEYVPAKETLRLYLEKIAMTQLNINKGISKLNINLLKKVTPSSIKCKYGEYIPNDIDVSPMDNSKSKKEGVSYTYKGYNGFAPIFSYIGTEGYMLHCELREGKQHCQKGTPDFLTENIKQLNKLNLPHPVLLRLDSGNDSIDTLKPITKSGQFFIIKRNIRHEKREKWLEIAKSLATKTEISNEKNLYIGNYTTVHQKDKTEYPLDIVFKVIERTVDKRGVPLLVPEIEIETYWTNLYETPETVIDLYHDHGTSEQFHSELKTDMDVERLPSGKMLVNSLILQLSKLAYNTLRMIGQTALNEKKLQPYKTKSKRKRLRKVISDIIYIAGKIVTHSRKIILRLWEHNPWTSIFQKLCMIFDNI